MQETREVECWAPRCAPVGTGDTCGPAGTGDCCTTGEPGSWATGHTRSWATENTADSGGGDWKLGRWAW